MCEVCNGQSGGKDVGVACIPGVPMSIMWCDSCLQAGAFPSFVFDHDWIHLANGHLRALNKWAKQRITWADGRYMGFREYIRRITPEQIKKERRQMEKAMRRSRRG